MGAVRQKKCLLFCLFVVVCLLTACQQAPQEVLERKDAYGENKQMDMEEIQYCTVEQLNQASMKDIQYSPQNLELPEKVDFSSIKEVNLLTLEFEKDYTQYKDKIANFFKIADPKWELFEGTLQGDTGISYESQEEKIYVFVGENGTISYIADKCYDDLQKDELDNQIKKIYVDKQDDTNVTCVLGSKKTTVAEEIKWAENWLKQCDLTNEDCDYKIKIVYLREMEDGSQQLSMLAQIQYQGISLDYFGGGLETVNNKPLVRQMDEYIVLDINQKDNISHYGNNGSLLIKNAEEIAEIVDFPSAVKIVEKELSGFHKVKISEIKALYALYPEYDYESGKDYYAAPGNIVNGHPVYSFLIEYGEDTSSLGILEGNSFCYVNVDMLTGEVTSNLKEKGFTAN